MLTSVPWGADSQDTAEFMLGDVLVSVVLLESDGSLDPSQEDWTSETIEQVQAKVREGLQWWEDRLDEQGTVHDLDFQIDFTYAEDPIQTGYEPISRPSDDFVLWLDDFFRAAGVGSEGSFSERIWEFNHAQRLKYDTNWAFTILIVNAAEDANGRFDATGTFSQSFAFAGGRFFVTTSERPASTIAHETAHMFWALDEYAGGRPFAEQRGYYNTANQNAADGHPNPDLRVTSIMDSHVIAYPAHAVSPSAREMIGWRDSDGDGIFDVLDVPHSLSGQGAYLAEESLYGFQGHSQVGVLPNQNSMGSGHDLTLNRIRQVEVRFDDSDWRVVENFEQYEVDLTLRIPVPAGAETIEIRTVDERIGVTSPVFRDVLPTAVAIPWQNLSQPLDVNGDLLISPVDALLVINALNQQGPGPLPARTTAAAPFVYLDSSGDGFLSALDALLVINELNREPARTAVGVLTTSSASSSEQAEAELSDDARREIVAAVDAVWSQSRVDDHEPRTAAGPVSSEPPSRPVRKAACLGDHRELRGPTSEPSRFRLDTRRVVSWDTSERSLDNRLGRDELVGDGAFPEIGIGQE